MDMSSIVVGICAILNIVYTIWVLSTGKVCRVKDLVMFLFLGIILSPIGLIFTITNTLDYLSKTGKWDKFWNKPLLNKEKGKN
jgi:hypothetical protein